MLEIPAPGRRALAVLADAARELAHGLARTIGDTADIIADALDSRPETPPGPIAGLLAAMHRADLHAGDNDTTPDRPWTLTPAKDLTRGTDIRTYGGYVLTVKEAQVVDDHGEMIIHLHVTDPAGRPQVITLGAETPLLACPATPDDASALAP